MVRQAAAAGAQIILLSELFEREYFCQQRRYDFYSYAKPVEENEAVCWGQKLAKELKVVLPISFYEKEVNNLYNRGQHRCGRRNSRRIPKNTYPG